MWVKDKQSKIQMDKEISTCKGKFQQLPLLMERGICFLKEKTASAPWLQSKYSREFPWAQNLNCFLKKLEGELLSQNKNIIEFILILTLWAKEKQSEIQMVKEISTCKGRF